MDLGARINLAPDSRFQSRGVDCVLYFILDRPWAALILSWHLHDSSDGPLAQKLTHVDPLSSSYANIHGSPPFYPLRPYLSIRNWVSEEASSGGLAKSSREEETLNSGAKLKWDNSFLTLPSLAQSPLAGRVPQESTCSQESLSPNGICRNV